MIKMLPVSVSGIVLLIGFVVGLNIGCRSSSTADALPVGLSLYLKESRCSDGGTPVILYAPTGDCRVDIDGATSLSIPKSICLQPKMYELRITCTGDQPLTRHLEVTSAQNIVLFVQTGKTLHNVAIPEMSGKPSAAFSDTSRNKAAQDLLNRARNIRLKGKLQASIRLLEQSLDANRSKMKPDVEAETWCELSLAYLYLGKIGIARHAWSRGHAIQPNHPTCLALVNGEPRSNAPAKVDVTPQQCASLGPDPAQMMRVPAGSFYLGAQDAKKHLETFCMDKTEVTVRRYRRCVVAGKCPQPNPRGARCTWNGTQTDEYPINCISWEMAKTYCAWAQKRLPTEAEWEKAARGPDGRRFPWGDNFATCDVVSMPGDSPNCGNGRIHPVGEKPLGASPYGILDMAGNVFEWTKDVYTSAETHLSSGPPLRAIRGGNGTWPVQQTAWQRSGRVPVLPQQTDGTVGFRCVR